MGLKEFKSFSDFCLMLIIYSFQLEDPDVQVKNAPVIKGCNICTTYTVNSCELSQVTMPINDSSEELNRIAQTH